MAGDKSNAKGLAYWYTGRTQDNHLIPECSSAFQKSVRRGLVDDSVYWALQLSGLGYANYVWKRLKIIVSEDVGIANPTLPTNVYALWKMWEEGQKAKTGNPNEGRLFLIHAIMLVAMSPKSRAYALNSTRIIGSGVDLDKCTKCKISSTGRRYPIFTEESHVAAPLHHQEVFSKST
jgi:replication-associated recombination protein RarA